MAHMVEAIRAAIDRSGKTRYRIAKDTGIAQSVLSRLMSGERSLDIETVERLAHHLGLEIVIKPKQRRKGRQING